MVQRLDVRMARFRDVLVEQIVELLEELTTQPVAVCQKCEMWIDMDDLLTNKPDYDTNMLLQVDPNYGPKD